MGASVASRSKGRLLVGPSRTGVERLQGTAFYRVQRAECALCATCSAARVRRAQCVQWTACTPCVVPAVNSVAGVQRVQCRACTACTVHPLDLCSVQWVQRVQPALRLHFSVACTMCNAYNIICAAYTM